MLGKKGNEIKWSQEARSSFVQIKKFLVEALVLVIPGYTKDFLVFSFASKHTIVVVLLQKNHEGYEKPISFSINPLEMLN